MSNRGNTSLITSDLAAAATLLDMLSFKRPGGSKTERKFIRQYLTPLGLKPDMRGNLSLRIGDAPVMWSCHTDTVHNLGGKQGLVYTAPGIIGVDPASKSNCLGADDTAGIWLMREMILAKVPGLYVFHRDEESGCIGSNWIAKFAPETVHGIKFAIALDRKNKTDVITHQGPRTCSDEFAGSLAAELGMGYKPSSLGLFTDTASYTDLIGECTNLSVGYEGAHTSGEQLDQYFLFELREKLVHLDVSKLELKREPGEVDQDDFSWANYGYGNSEPVVSIYKKDPVTGRTTYTYSGGKYTSSGKKYGTEYDYESLYDKTSDKSPTRPSAHDQYYLGKMSMETLIRNHPAEIADLLADYGFETHDIEKYLWDTLGYIRDNH